MKSFSESPPIACVQMVTSSRRVRTSSLWLYEHSGGLDDMRVHLAK